MANLGGRPPKFESPEQLQKLIDNYFEWCEPHPEIVTEWIRPKKKIIKDDKEIEVDDFDEPMYTHEIERLTRRVSYTINGLAMFLDTTRETLLDYEHNDRFSDTIKAAKTKIQNELELSLYGNSVTGVIFNLKNNYGWKDKTEVDTTISGELKTGNSNPELEAKFAEFMKNNTGE